jgi:hypothetical protein
LILFFSFISVIQCPEALRDKKWFLSIFDLRFSQWWLSGVMRMYCYVVPSKCQMTFNRPYGVISKKTEL